MLGTRGGPNRIRILETLSQRPYNANQLAEILSMDYKTIRHHLEILLENSLVIMSKEKRYGELYHITDYARMNLQEFNKDKIRK